MDEPTDPRDVRSIAVSIEDVVTALEYNRQREDRAVLRVTPPFHGRMRARIHAGGESETSPEPIEIPPESLVDGERVPSYPRVDDTEAATRDTDCSRLLPVVAGNGGWRSPATSESNQYEDPAVEYSVEAHYERHATALEEWREAVAGAIADRVRLETSTGEHTVGVETIE